MNRQRTSFKFAAFLGTSLFMAPLAAAETPDWKTELARDLVELGNGKMTIEGFDLCKIGDGNLQLRTYSEAPHDGSISRDNFVAITTMSVSAYLAALGDAECKDIQAPIGNVDLEVSIVMTGNGIKQTFRDLRTNTENSTTALWSEILGI